VGGAESAPASFWSRFGLRGAAYELLRNVARAAGRLDPFVRVTARRAAFAFAANRETGAALEALGCANISILSQVSLSRDDLERLACVPNRQCGPFRVLSAGRLLHWKGFELSLDAFAALARAITDVEYWVIGAGPELARLKKRALRLGIADRVTFLGNVPREGVLDAMARCDVLVHPSLHESGGWICLEALAAGRPVICFDIGGPAAMITEDTGIKIAALAPDQAIRDMARALTTLHNDPEFRRRLGTAARKFARREFVARGDLWGGIQSAGERLERTSRL
jgi:glycosyltransferase involved in cell wall biosynthesis